ncbi:MAG: signal peptide peptidase SppA [Verrucomicrobiales bacterium]|jgi:protease-4|nr:signal peptide peptidase SppA [Verrucomicrobiales bacterium]MDB4467707.1 signal peptide peptidase SppA [Verrucomicrobiales bacterium]MDB4772892.1 signal peptide peptidase SppA [Verrucomicrobiales bacterium]MDF1788636.1 signal peptide peptidase SppA [Verrucomicrobiales bacterium]
MSKRTLVILSLLLIFLLGASVLMNFALVVSAPFRGMSAARAPGNFREIELYAGSRDAKIVHIDIEGMISSMGGSPFVPGSSLIQTKRMLEAAVVDPNVKAMVVRINSPGGEVTASDALYHAVKTAASKKPVVIYMDSMAASGGYYIACGGTHLMANETTLTGSIGVIIQALNYKEMFGKVGLNSVVFTSGKFKDMLSPSRDMRPEERVYVQGMVDEMYTRFLGIVAEARSIPVEILKSGIADGRVITGKQALSDGLIDETGYIEAAYKKARELGNAPNGRVVKYGGELGLGQLLGVLGSASTEAGKPTRVELSLGDAPFPKLQPGAVYLLPAHFAL